jgi:hypothetical protein
VLESKINTLHTTCGVYEAKKEATMSRIRSTKKYRALVAIGMSDEQAVKALTPVVIEPEPLPEFPAYELLVKSGQFSPEEATALLASLSTDEPVHPAPAPTPVPVILTSKEKGEALVANAGFTFTRGRVYGTGTLLEAAARVLKTGTPEIVASSGAGHVAAVLVYREDSGDFAFQNLSTPKE